MIIPNVQIDFFDYLCSLKRNTMYNLEQLFDIVGPDSRHELWQGRISCTFTDSKRTFLTNKMSDSFSGYTFTLIRSGQLTLLSDNRLMHLKADDMYTYFPGSLVTIQSVSDDYHGICLMLDEGMAHDALAFRNLIRASMIPISQFGNSKLHFTSPVANRLAKLLELIYEYIQQPGTLKNEILEMLYNAFIDDLIGIQAFDKLRLEITRQTEDIFVSFYQLLQKNFVEQHGIAFYADQLHISANYLSRIVKRITGKTVVDCINEMLAIEATWFIKSTDLNVAQIADRLNFASSPSFCKFYKRMRGHAPLVLRKQQPH